MSVADRYPRRAWLIGLVVAGATSALWATTSLAQAPAKSPAAGAVDPPQLPSAAVPAQAPAKSLPASAVVPPEVFRPAGVPVGVPGKRALLCPLKSVRAEVVSKLPAGWWQTPQEGGLVEVRIETIAEKPTLVCEYEGYGARVSIMHALPEAAKRKCVADKIGALCW